MVEEKEIREKLEQEKQLLNECLLYQTMAEQVKERIKILEWVLSNENQRRN